MSGKVSPAALRSAAPAPPRSCRRPRRRGPRDRARAPARSRRDGGRGGGLFWGGGGGGGAGGGGLLRGGRSRRRGPPAWRGGLGTHHHPPGAGGAPRRGRRGAGCHLLAVPARRGRL